MTAVKGKTPAAANGTGRLPEQLRPYFIGQLDAGTNLVTARGVSRREGFYDVRHREGRRLQPADVGKPGPSRTARSLNRALAGPASAGRPAA